MPKQTSGAQAAQEPVQVEAAVQAETSVQDEPIDWKAKYEAMREHSREWERKARSNQESADELEKLKAENRDELEKLKAANKDERDRAQAELAEMKARAERAETVSAVADAHGVPAELVAMFSGADADELGRQVKKALKLLPAYPTRTDDGGGSCAPKASAAQQFADIIGNI